MSVSLRQITADTVRLITDLAVRPDQQHFVASNAVSLAEALFHEEAWYRAIYEGESPAGFVMLYDETLRKIPPSKPEVSLWRFMIDANFQGRGIGKAALGLVIDQVRSQGVFSLLKASYVPGPGCAKDFYLRYGFHPTGETDEGEVVLTLPL
ncbi:MAG: GNAT family N-acetyltransferase [Cyanobacteria bacterium J06642_9]